MTRSGIDSTGRSVVCPKCGTTVGLFDLRYPFPDGPPSDPVGCVCCLSTADPGVYRISFEEALAEVQPAAPVWFVAVLLVIILGGALAALWWVL